MGKIWTENVIEFTELESSNLARAAYLPSQKIVLVEFKDGGGFVYAGVGEGMWLGLLNAVSAGSYFATVIKKQPCLKYRDRAEG
jgi:hypothetical protein